MRQAPGKLAEGEITPTPTHDTIEYTGVTSCLTLTVLYSDGTASGGHAGIFPPNGQRTIKGVVDALKVQAQGKTISKVVVAGEIEQWNQNLPNLGVGYQTVDEIIRDLSPSSATTQYDSDDDFQGKGGAYMSLSSDHRQLLVRKEDGTVVRTKNL